MAINEVISNRMLIFIVTVLCCLCYTIKCEDYNSCGQRSAFKAARIYSGEDSRRGLWPWQVSIFNTSISGKTGKFHCGGAIIGAKWIVTAAHCVTDNPLHQYKIVAGDFKMYFKDEDEQESFAKKVYLHPEYNSSTLEKDIAVVELDRNVKMGPNVRPVCLPTAGEKLSVPNKKIGVAGWGRLESGSFPPALRHTFLTIQSNDLCRSTTTKHFNDKVMFCAGDGLGYRDTCKGDSGGSTVIEVRRNGGYRWVTVGLVSWGEGCGIKGRYGYYTRMEPFVNWINDITTGESGTSEYTASTSPPKARLSTSEYTTSTSPPKARLSTSEYTTSTSPPKARLSTSEYAASTSPPKARLSTSEYTTSTSPPKARLSTSEYAASTSPPKARPSTSEYTTSTSPPKATLSGMTLIIHFIFVTFRYL